MIVRELQTMIFVIPKINSICFNFQDRRQQNGSVIFRHENARDILRKELI